jgi:phosphatidylglycerol:prolipoprotein diacylglycerol transferase
LIEIGKLAIHSYGVMLALSFLLGIWLARHRAQKRDLDPGVVSDVGFWIILAAIVGARAYYVLLHMDEFVGDLGAVFNPFHGDTLGIGGLVMYGGFIGAIIAGFLFFRLKKLSFLPYADTVAPSLGLGIFLTRIGCFLNGCCYGAAHTGACSVSYPANSPAGVYQRHIHAEGLFPSQLLLSAGGLAMMLIVLFAGKKRPFNGFEFYLTGVLYSILRFGADFTRYYAPDEMVAGLSHNQIVCIGLFILFGGLILKEVLFKDEAAPEAQEASEERGEEASEAVKEQEV